MSLSLSPSRPWNSDGVVTHLYHSLSCRQRSGKDNAPTIRIPTTIVYEHHYPRDWYYFDSDLGEIRRHSVRGLDCEAIFGSLLRTSRRRRGLQHLSCDLAHWENKARTAIPSAEPVVATYLGIDSEEAEVAPKVQFLTPTTLAHFLRRGSNDEHGVLQSYAPPVDTDNSAFLPLLQCAWSPYVAVTEKRSIGGCGNGSANDGGVGVIGGHLRARLVSACETIASHFAAVEHRQLRRLVCWYRLDRKDRLVLQWVSSVRVQSRPGDTPDSQRVAQRPVQLISPVPVDVIKDSQKSVSSPVDGVWVQVRPATLPSSSSTGSNSSTVVEGLPSMDDLRSGCDDNVDDDDASSCLSSCCCDTDGDLDELLVAASQDNEKYYAATEQSTDIRESPGTRTTGSNSLAESLVRRRRRHRDRQRRLSAAGAAEGNGQAVTGNTNAGFDVMGKEDSQDTDCQPPPSFPGCIGCGGPGAECNLSMRIALEYAERTDPAVRRFLRLLRNGRITDSTDSVDVLRSPRAPVVPVMASPSSSSAPCSRQRSLRTDDSSLQDVVNGLWASAEGRLATGKEQKDSQGTGSLFELNMGPVFAAAKRFGFIQDSRCNSPSTVPETPNTDFRVYPSNYSAPITSLCENVCRFYGSAAGSQPPCTQSRPRHDSPSSPLSTFSPVSEHTCGSSLGDCSPTTPLSPSSRRGGTPFPPLCDVARRHFEGIHWLSDTLYRIEQNGVNGVGCVRVGFGGRSGGPKELVRMVLEVLEKHRVTVELKENQADDGTTVLIPPLKTRSKRALMKLMRRELYSHLRAELHGHYHNDRPEAIPDIEMVQYLISTYRSVFGVAENGCDAFSPLSTPCTSAPGTPSSSTPPATPPLRSTPLAVPPLLLRAFPGASVARYLELTCCAEELKRLIGVCQECYLDMTELYSEMPGDLPRSRKSLQWTSPSRESFCAESGVQQSALVRRPNTREYVPLRSQRRMSNTL